MFNTLYGHVVFNNNYGYVYFTEISNAGGSEHVALFANDMLELDNTSVNGQRMPIIVKNVPTNAPMGMTTSPLYNYYSPHGPEEYRLSGLSTIPPSAIDYKDTLENELLNLSWPDSESKRIEDIYFFPDQHTILYCIIAYYVSRNSSNTIDLTVKLAVATQNAVTGEIVDEQIFELPIITNLVADFNWYDYTYYSYGLKLLGTDYYCVFLKNPLYGDIRIHLFITLKTDRITVNGKSWQVLRNPQLQTIGQAHNNIKNWISHVVINDTTFVCVESRKEYYPRDYTTAVLAIDQLTNSIIRYICNYYFYYGSY